MMIGGTPILGNHHIITLDTLLYELPYCQLISTYLREMGDHRQIRGTSILLTFQSIRVSNSYWCSTSVLLK